jgi:hypothetical protein
MPSKIINNLATLPQKDLSALAWRDWVKTSNSVEIQSEYFRRRRKVIITQPRHKMHVGLGTIRSSYALHLFCRMVSGFEQWTSYSWNISGIFSLQRSTRAFDCIILYDLCEIKPCHLILINRVSSSTIQKV